MRENLKISFPHMGDYHFFFADALKQLFPDAEIITPPPTTRATLELGAKHSPDAVCAPFKYTLGNFIEALNCGANVLVQTGLGCIFGYYGEVQEKILRDLGYDFDFLCFSHGFKNIKSALKLYWKLGGAGLSRAASVLFTALLKIRIMDSFEYRLREAVTDKRRVFYRDALRSANGILGIIKVKKRMDAFLKSQKTSDNKDGLRIGIVGELFTLMDEFSNFQIEKMLQNSGVSVSRKMSVTFLLIPHKNKSKRQTSEVLTHELGATGTDTIAQTIAYSKNNYDGIIHLKSFGCIPEVNASAVLNAYSASHNIPVLELSFDTHTAAAGIETRVEAFIDMLNMRRGIA